MSSNENHVHDYQAIVGSVASVATIRAAIMDVIDAGDPYMAGRIWFFYERINQMDIWGEDQASEQRCGFADAVIARIAELQQPSLNTDNYQSGYADGWAAAHTATLREQNADLKEMLRLAQVRRE